MSGHETDLRCNGGLDFNIKRLFPVVSSQEREPVLSENDLIRQTSYSDIAAVVNTSTTKYTTKPHTPRSPEKRTSRYRQKPPKRAEAGATKGFDETGGKKKRCEGRNNKPA